MGSAAWQVQKLGADFSIQRSNRIFIDQNRFIFISRKAEGLNLRVGAIEPAPANGRFTCTRRGKSVAGHTINSIFAFIILLCLPVDLWLLSLLCEDWMPRINRLSIRIQQGLFSLNFAYAYLTIDATVSVAICLSLYHLTYIGGAQEISPTAVIARWGGVILIMSYCILEFPIKPIIRLLYPILERWRDRPAWVDRLKRIPCAAIGDLLVPWAEGASDSAHWIGLCILGGAVMPYLGIVTILWMLEGLKATLGISGTAARIFELFSLLSDSWGALVIVALMLNLLVLSFPDLTLGQILSSGERQ